MQSRVFSSPGKALLAGGYLVLDPQYEAFVVALSAKMHARITKIEQLSPDDQTEITVSSPQFKNGLWSYKIDLAKLPNIDLKESNGRKNPFVKSTILTVLSYLLPKVNYRILITIFSDSGYHSQRDSVVKSSLNGKMQFAYHTLPITSVPKTGLGSSAGLVTSLTAALFCCYSGPQFLTKDASKTLDRLHNLAQVAHCIAQGKVGSGFDVASAVYGSIVYRRFSPSLINSLMELEPSKFASGLKKLVDDTNWKVEHKQCCLVKGVHILMGDIAGGSETPKLVSKVNQWKEKDPEYALKVWTELNGANMKLVKCLESLQEVASSKPEEYNQLLSYLSDHSAKEILSDGSQPLLKEVVTSIEHIRRYLKIMTVKSGAEIEPDEQTTLLDNCELLKGCLGGVVPGAGGYDAICLLVAEKSIDSIINSTKDDPKFTHVHWLRLAEQRQGLLEENAEDFEGL